MEESRGNANTDRDSPVVQAMEEGVTNQEPRRNGDTFTPYPFRSPTLEAIEIPQKG